MPVRPKNTPRANIPPEVVRKTKGSVDAPVGRSGGLKLPHCKAGRRNNIVDEYFFCRLARASPQTNYLAVRAGARAGAPAYMYYTIHVAVGTLFFKKSLSLLQNIFFLRFHDSQTGAGQPVIKISREAGWRAPGHASPQTRYQIMWDVVAKSFQQKIFVIDFKLQK